MDTEQSSPQRSDPPLEGIDKLFIFFMLVMSCLVAWMGYQTYQKGMVEETSKRNGEAWLQWLSASAKQRHEPGFQPATCGAQLAPAVPSWGECYESVTAPEGPLGKLTNPYSGSRLQRITKCDNQDRTLAGSLVFEKTTATPPGSAIPSIMTALVDSDEIGAKVQIRISVCDKGSNPIRIGELEF
jgi:hypothetical protein